MEPEALATPNEDLALGVNDLTEDSVRFVDLDVDIALAALIKTIESEDRFTRTEAPKGILSSLSHGGSARQTRRS